MSGHSKWSTIKHRKLQHDQKRGALFSRLAVEISAAVREGGGVDQEFNPRLRGVLQKARAANMPSENISRAVARGLGQGAGEGVEAVVYEGYGPAGVAILAVVRTDNRQRTAAEIKHAFEEVGGSLGGPGSASFLFEARDGGFVPKVLLPIHDEATRQSLRTFIERLRSRPDIVSVYSSASLPDE